MAVKPIPVGYHSVTPYLIVHDASRAIEFYKTAFGAVELFRVDQPDGKVGHAEVRIGDSNIMLADEYPDMGYRAPKSLGGTPVSMVLYVEDCDKTFGKAVAAGATVRKEMEDQFYGDRSGTVDDPFGHTWMISTHKEDLTPEEVSRRAEEWMKQHAGA
jgi:PhnB protein